MDVNILRAAVTVVSFACFAGIVAWAWARRNRAGFEDCGRIPFLAGETDEQP